jgi:hypothetical protein
MKKEFYYFQQTCLQDLNYSEAKENDLLQARIRAILDECIHLNRLLKLDYSIEVRSI